MKTIILYNSIIDFAIERVIRRAISIFKKKREQSRRNFSNCSINIKHKNETISEKTNNANKKNKK